MIDLNKIRNLKTLEAMKIDLTEEDLLADYSNFAVAVDPINDKMVSFQLVDQGVIDDEQ